MSFVCTNAVAQDHNDPLDRFLKDDLVGYLSSAKEHSAGSITNLLKEYRATRISRFVVSGYAQGISSVVYTIIESKEGAWVDVSWLFTDWKVPKVYRTQLKKGDLTAWRFALDSLDHEELKSVDDTEGKRKLDGRSIWLAVKSLKEEFQFGFPNPSYSTLPELQSIRFLDLLVTDWSKHSFGPAKYEYEPNRGTKLLN